MNAERSSALWLTAAVVGSGAIVYATGRLLGWEVDSTAAVATTAVAALGVSAWVAYCTWRIRRAIRDTKRTAEFLQRRPVAGETTPAVGVVGRLKLFFDLGYYPGRPYRDLSDEEIVERYAETLAVIERGSWSDTPTERIRECNYLMEEWERRHGGLEALDARAERISRP